MLKAMIVDDMEIARRELKRLKLWGEKSGFVISVEASNGGEALEKLEKEPVDLIITDIKMPKLDGIELLAEVMERKLCPCVVLLSDYSDFRYARKGLVLGAFDYMLKPVDESELSSVLQRVKSFIKKKRNEQKRIKELELKLEEKVEVYFPNAEVDRLLNAIKAGDRQAVEYAEHVTDIVWENLNHDLIRTESLINNVMLVMKKRLLESCRWLEKFMNDKGIGAINCSRAEKIDDIKGCFTSAVGEIIALMEKLRCKADDNGVVNPVCRFVLENIDNGISLQSAADSLFMNKSYLSESFKQKTGISFIEYLTIVKMERARQLLADERLRAYEVAELLGFRDIEYFSRLFKKYSGLSPTEYRQSIGSKV